MNSGLVSCHIIFKGMVQGVGFRYTVKQLVHSYSVTGFVRNLYSGSVEIMVEGEREEIERFIRAIHDDMGGYIKKSELEWGVYTGEFIGFGVKF